MGDQPAPKPEEPSNQPSREELSKAQMSHWKIFLLELVEEVPGGKPLVRLAKKLQKRGWGMKALVVFAICCAGVFGLFLWPILKEIFGPSEGAKLSTSGTNSPAVSGSSNYFDYSTHNATSNPMSGILSDNQSQPQVLSLGGAQFYSTSDVLLSENGDPVISVKFPSPYKMLVSAEIRDKSGNLAAELTDNEWHVNQASLFDRNYSDKALEVRGNDGNVILQVALLRQVIYVAGVFHLKNGRSFTITQDNDANPIFDFSGAFKILPMFAYPSDLHLGNCPGYDSLNEKYGALDNGHIIMTTRPIDLAMPPRSGSDKSTSPSVVQTMSNSPGGMQAGRDINVNVAPKRGLRLLKTDFAADGESTVTSFTFGSQMLESTPRYSITLKFAKPYMTANASLQPLTNIVTDGGFDGRPPQTNSSEFVISGAGIGQSYLILKFTAPYKMELLSSEISPPPEN